MLIAGFNDQLLFPLVQAAVFTDCPFGWFDFFGRAPEEDAVLNRRLEDSAYGSAELIDIALGQAVQGVVQAFDVRCGDLADILLVNGFSSVLRTPFRMRR